MKKVVQDNPHGTPDAVSLTNDFIQNAKGQDRITLILSELCVCLAVGEKQETDPGTEKQSAKEKVQINMSFISSLGVVENERHQKVNIVIEWVPPGDTRNTSKLDYLVIYNQQVKGETRLIISIKSEILFCKVEQCGIYLQFLQQGGWSGRIKGSGT